MKRVLYNRKGADTFDQNTKINEAGSKYGMDISKLFVFYIKFVFREVITWKNFGIQKLNSLKKSDFEVLFSM